MEGFRKYIRLIGGIILFLIGIGFMLIPFLPIGYIFIFIGSFFLATYIPFLKRFLTYLKKKDKSRILNRIEKLVTKFEKLLARKGSKQPPSIEDEHS